MTAVVPREPMTDVQGRIFARAVDARIPLAASVEIIATCNFRCQHCYIAPCATRTDVMPLERARLLFEILAAHGTMTLLLTGGEVFSHRDFREIYLAAKRAGFHVYVNSNAYFIGERWADFLAEWPPRQLSISLYGLSNERYEEVTGIPNAFDRVCRAIDLLRERGVRFDLKCPAMTLTADELPRMKEFAEARGAIFRYDTSIMPQERGEVKPLQLQLAPRQVVELDEKMKLLPEFSRRLERATPPGPHVYKCGAGRTSLAINVHGGVSTCISSRQTLGNIFEQPFDEIWSALGGKVAVQYPPGHPCATCRFRSICTGCPATVEQLTGMPTGYVQHYCRITHLRAQAIGWHPTGVPRTVTEGLATGIPTPFSEAVRALPVLS